MNRKQEQYQEVTNWPRRLGKGHLLKHLSDGHLSRNQAILAKCYECCGGDDHGYCTITTCPLFPYSQYNKKNNNKEILLSEE